MKSSFPERYSVVKTVFNSHQNNSRHFCFEAVGGDLMTFQTINSAARSY